MGFVIDASILAGFALADERPSRVLAAIERLLEETALAPSLLFFEIRTSCSSASDVIEYRRPEPTNFFG